MVFFAKSVKSVKSCILQLGHSTATIQREHSTVRWIGIYQITLVHQLIWSIKGILFPEQLTTKLLTVNIAHIFNTKEICNTICVTFLKNFKELVDVAKQSLWVPKRSSTDPLGWSHSNNDTSYLPVVLKYVDINKVRQQFVIMCMQICRVKTMPDREIFLQRLKIYRIQNMFCKQDKQAAVCSLLFESCDCYLRRFSLKNTIQIGDL